MHELEIEILNKIIGSKIKSMVFSRAIYDFQEPKFIISHAGMMLRFSNKENNLNSDYLCINAIKGLSTKGSFVLLKYWQYIHKQPLKHKMHFPNQDMDSSFKTSFSVSYLGKLIRVSANSNDELQEGILSFIFENGNIYMVCSENSIYIHLDNKEDEDTFFKKYYKTTEIVNIANVTAPEI